MSKFDEDVRDQTHDVMVGEVGVRSEFQRLQECSAVACWMPDILAKVNNEERRSMFWEACQLLQTDMLFTLWPPESSGVLRLWPEREAMLDQYDKLCDAICANEQPNWFDIESVGVAVVYDKVGKPVPSKRKHLPEECTRGCSFSVRRCLFQHAAPKLHQAGDAEIAVGDLGHVLRVRGKPIPPGTHGLLVEVTSLRKSLSLERVAASIEVQPEFRSPTTWHARRIFHRLRRRST